MSTVNPDVLINVDELEQIARRATKGRWWHRTAPGRSGFVQVDIPDNKMAYQLELLGDDYNGFGDEEQRENDCAFVAAANPEVVLALIHRLRVAEAKLEAIPKQN